MSGRAVGPRHSCPVPVALSTCVIYNPAAGRGKAEQAARSRPPALRPGASSLRPTDGPGHAVELARKAAGRGVRTRRRGRRRRHRSRGRQRASRGRAARRRLLGLAARVGERLRLHPRPRRSGGRSGRDRPPTTSLDVDVGVVAAGGRERFFVNGCGVGFNGMVDARVADDPLAPRACRCTSSRSSRRWSGTSPPRR